MERRRRLSRLQKWILCAAWDNDASDGEPDLVYAEILAGYFGMPYTHELRGEWGHKFAKSLENYNSASASTSRAVHRLAERELVTVTRGKPVGAPRSRPLTEEETRELDRLLEERDMSSDEIYFSPRYGWRIDPSREALGRAEIRLTGAGFAVAKTLLNCRPVSDA